MPGLVHPSVPSSVTTVRGPALGSEPRAIYASTIEAKRMTSTTASRYGSFRSSKILVPYDIATTMIVSSTPCHAGAVYSGLCSTINPWIIVPVPKHTAVRNDCQPSIPSQPTT